MAIDREYHWATDAHGPELLRMSVNRGFFSLDQSDHEQGAPLLLLESKRS